MVSPKPDTCEQHITVRSDFKFIFFLNSILSQFQCVHSLLSCYHPLLRPPLPTEPILFLTKSPCYFHVLCLKPIALNQEYVGGYLLELGHFSVATPPRDLTPFSFQLLTAYSSSGRYGALQVPPLSMVECWWPNLAQVLCRYPFL